MLAPGALVAQFHQRLDELVHLVLERVEVRADAHAGARAVVDQDPARFQGEPWADDQLNARAIDAYAAYYALSSTAVGAPSP